MPARPAGFASRAVAGERRARVIVGPVDDGLAVVVDALAAHHPHERHRLGTVAQPSVAITSVRSYRQVMPLRDNEAEILTARDRAELAWWREFALKFRGPRNLPRPGDPLTRRQYRLQEEADDGTWRDVIRGTRSS